MHLERLLKIKSYEHAEMALRRHPFTFLKHIVVLLVLAGLPYAVFQVISGIYPWILLGQVSYPLLVLGASIYYLWIWLFFFGQFIDFYLDVWIVTNDRIVNIEQKGLFARTISELDLYKVQDVTSEVHGMLHTFFNYGNVHVQTAGEQERFIFRQIPRPHDVRKRILELIEEDRKYHMTQIGHP